MSTPFKPPKGQRVCLQYIQTNRDGEKEPIAIVTEKLTKSEPDFDKEVWPSL